MIKINSFEYPKSIRNYEKKKYLERQTLGRRVVCPIGPANQHIQLLIHLCFETIVIGRHGRHKSVVSSAYWHFMRACARAWRNEPVIKDPIK